MSDFHYNSVQLVLPVNDMKSARNWYEDRLGFRTDFLNRDEDDPDGNFATLTRDTARLMLILDEGKANSHPWTVAGNGYLFLQVKNVEAVHAFVKERGLVAQLAKQSWGAKGFYLEDPSGNQVMVAEDLHA